MRKDNTNRTTVEVPKTLAAEVRKVAPFANFSAFARAAIKEKLERDEATRKEVA